MRRVFGERENPTNYPWNWTTPASTSTNMFVWLQHFCCHQSIFMGITHSHIHTYIVCVVGNLVVGTTKWANRTDALDTNNVYEHTFYLDRNKWAWNVCEIVIVSASTTVCALCVCSDVSKSKQSLQLKGLLSFDRQLFRFKTNGVPYLSGKTRSQPPVSHPAPPLHLPQSPLSLSTLVTFYMLECAQQQQQNRIVMAPNGNHILMNSTTNAHAHAHTHLQNNCF